MTFFNFSEHDQERATNIYVYIMLLMLMHGYAPVGDQVSKTFYNTYLMLYYKVFGMFLYI